jgi:excisionase family DNA binding protein
MEKFSGIPIMSKVATKPDKFYLTLKEAAKLSGLPQAYLLRKIKEGAIPVIKVPSWRIWREDLERYCIASNGDESLRC